MDDASETPAIKDLENILYGGKRSGNHVDEVWPNLFLGDMSVANDRFSVWKLGITHVLNAAHGHTHSHGSQSFYGPTLHYCGVPADDSPSFNLTPFFKPCADYIREVLNSPGERVLVHCAVGVSRSAALVLAYLMIHQQLPLLDAITTVKRHRWIFPNRGFLRQLRALDVMLRHRT